MLRAGFVALLGLALGYALLQPAIHNLLGVVHIDVRASSGLASLFSIVLLWVALGPAFLGLGMFFSVFHWEELSREVEREVHGPNVPNHVTPHVVGIWDGIKRTPRGIFVMVLSLLLSPILFGLLSAGLTGYQSAYDLTGPAFARRGVFWSEQKRFASRVRGRGGLMLAAGIISLVPILNLLLIPSLVAGATLLVAREYPHGCPGSAFERRISQ